MPKDPNALRLRDLVEPPGPVEFPGGREYACKPFTYRMHAMAREIMGMPEGEAQDEKLRELVAMCVPDGADEVPDLTPEQMLAVVGHAQKRLDAVLEYLESRKPKGNVAGRAARSRRPPPSK